MRFILCVSIMLLSGCYMANGSPNSTYYWVKNGRGLSYKDKVYCSKLIHDGKEIYINAKCYYELGYRFTAPIYWCFALDSSTNRETCREYEKYRK